MNWIWGDRRESCPQQAPWFSRDVLFLFTWRRGSIRRLVRTVRVVPIQADAAAHLPGWLVSCPSGAPAKKSPYVVSMNPERVFSYCNRAGQYPSYLLSTLNTRKVSGSRVNKESNFVYLVSCCGNPDLRIMLSTGHAPAHYSPLFTEDAHHYRAFNWLNKVQISDLL